MAEDKKELGLHVKTTGDAAGVQSVSKAVDDLKSSTTGATQAQEESAETSADLADHLQNLRSMLTQGEKALRGIEAASKGGASGLAGLAGSASALTKIFGSLGSTIPIVAAVGAAAAGVYQLATALGEASVKMDDLAPSAEEVAKRLERIAEKKAAMQDIADATARANKQLDETVDRLSQVENLMSSIRAAGFDRNIAEIEQQVAMGSISVVQGEERIAKLKSDKEAFDATEEVRTIDKQLATLQQREDARSSESDDIVSRLGRGRLGWRKDRELRQRLQALTEESTQQDKEESNLQARRKDASIRLETIGIRASTADIVSRRGNQDAAVESSASDQDSRRKAAAEREASMTPAQRLRRAMGSVEPYYDPPEPGRQFQGDDVGRATQAQARQIIADAAAGQRTVEEALAALKEVGAVFRNLDRMKADIAQIQSQLKNGGAR